MYKKKLFLGKGKLLLSIENNTTAPHSHFAASILISLEEEFKLYIGKKEFNLKYCILKPNLFHHLVANQCKMIVLQIDPDLNEFVGLKELLKNKNFIDFDLPIEFLQEIKNLFTEEINCKSAKYYFDKLLNLIANYTPKNKIDYRIKLISKNLKLKLPEKISLDNFSKEFNISHSRLMHLFKQELGLSFRKYILWLRLHNAGRLMQNGISLTEAALESGFSDSAHLSRIFKKNFGLKPSEIFQNKEVKIFFCDTF